MKIGNLANCETIDEISSYISIEEINNNFDLNNFRNDEECKIDIDPNFKFPEPIKDEKIPISEFEELMKLRKAELLKSFDYVTKEFV